MITYVYGSLFYSPARVLVNPVNTVGSMGSGLSYDFKRFYPDMYDAYRARCEADEFHIGQLMLYRTPRHWILNLPVRNHFRAQSKTEYIEQALQKFAATYARQHITSVSFPMIGTENDDLSWDDEVRPLMEAYLAPLPVAVFVHIYDEAHPDPFEPERRSIRATRAWLNNTLEEIAFDTFWRDVAKISRKSGGFKTLDEGIPFRVEAASRPKAKRISLKIFPDDDDSIFHSGDIAAGFVAVCTAGGLQPATEFACGTG